MNYLAHLFLGSGNELRLVGSLLGDFVKGRLEHLPYEGELRRGIELHRYIDRYTDDHQVTARSRARFSAEKRRFAGMVVDMAYDHFLARHWRLFSDAELDCFAQHSYQVLFAHREVLPTACSRVVDYMAAEDWLSNYRRLDRIHRSLVGISRRRPRLAPLAGCGEELDRLYENLEADFLQFFPALLHELSSLELSPDVPASGK